MLNLLTDLRTVTILFLTLLVLMVILSHPKVNGFYPNYIFTLEGGLNVGIIILTILSL